MLQRKETKTLKQIKKEQSREAVRISQEVAAEVEEYTKHHVTGQLLTALALVLRKVYGWSDKDTLAALDEVNGITNALNAGEIDDHDLITECEQYGIKVSWEMAGDRLYIGALDVYEHKEADNND